MPEMLINNNQISTTNPVPVQVTGSSVDLPVKPGVILEVAGSAGVVNADVTPATDVSQCTDLTVQISGTWAGTISFQASNDNINWFSCIAQNVSSASNSPQTVTSVNGLYFIPTGFKWFRARETIYTSGSAVGNMVGNRQPTSNMAVGGAISINGSGNAITVSKGTLNGALNTRRISTADTNAVNIKASSTNLYGVQLMNTSAADRFLKLYNKATAPVLSSDVPVITIKMFTGDSFYSQFVAAMGLSFPLGISISITGLVADNDTTPCAAGDVIMTILYG